MSGSSLFALISARQRWLGARFNILAQNVANADTPGYLPRDLDGDAFRRFLARALDPQGNGGLRTTNPRHLPSPPDTIEARPRPSASFEIAPSGNGVVLSEEVQKLAETERGFTLATTLLRKYRSMLETVVGPNG